MNFLVSVHQDRVVLHCVKVKVVVYSLYSMTTHVQQTLPFPWQGGCQCSLQLLIQPWICAPVSVEYSNYKHGQATKTPVEANKDIEQECVSPVGCRGRCHDWHYRPICLCLYHVLPNSILHGAMIQPRFSRTG